MSIIRLRLPQRLASLQQQAITANCNPEELLSYALTMLNDDFIIEQYNPRLTPQPICVQAAKYCQEWAYLAFPLYPYHACDRIEVIGTDMVLYNAKGI